MAKADGVVTRDEIAAFRQVFQVPPGDVKEVARLFDIAKQDAAGFEPYAKQLHDMFRGQPAMLEALLDALFHIAKADGQYHPGEKAWLENVAALFGFSEADFRRIEAKHTVRPEDDPYRILGIEPDASDDEARAARRTLIREHHPDKLIAEGLPQEFIDAANEHMAKINAAWDAIAKETGAGVTGRQHDIGAICIYIFRQMAPGRPMIQLTESSPPLARHFEIAEGCAGPFCRTCWIAAESRRTKRRC